MKINNYSRNSNSTFWKSNSDLEASLDYCRNNLYTYLVESNEANHLNPDDSYVEDSVSQNSENFMSSLLAPTSSTPGANLPKIRRKSEMNKGVKSTLSKFARKKESNLSLVSKGRDSDLQQKILKDGLMSLIHKTKKKVDEAKVAKANKLTKELRKTLKTSSSKNSLKIDPIKNRNTESKSQPHPQR